MNCLKRQGDMKRNEAMEGMDGMDGRGRGVEGRCVMGDMDGKCMEGTEGVSNVWVVERVPGEYEG